MRYDIDVQGALQIENATQRTVALVGGKGAGKTTILKLLLKHIKNVPILVFDPLKAVKSKEKGYVFRVTRVYTDDELAKIAQVINKLLASKTKIIIQFDNLRKKAEVAFMDSFLPKLRMHNGFIFFDEIHELVPEAGLTGKYSEETERLIRHIRNKNVGVVMTSQRPASVSKMALGLTDYLIALRTTWSHDLDAIHKIIRRQYSKEEADTILAEIQTLPFLNAYVFDFVENTQNERKSEQK